MSVKKDVSMTGGLSSAVEKCLEIAETFAKDVIINAIKCKEENGQPCTCNALVKCSSAEDKDETVHIVKDVFGTNILISDIGQLGENDITMEKAYTGCKGSSDKLCALGCIEPKKWQETYEGAELNDKEGALDVESSYMICTHGNGILFFEDAGQMVKTYEDEEVIRVEEYVTLEMMEESENDWGFREMIGYDVVTSLPQYKGDTKVRAITQEDVDEINRVLNIYGINTPNRIAHFLAQSQVETNGGYYIVEQYEGDDIFEYFKEYETGKKKIELGNTQEGDGAKYRGAGAVQITGRAAYEAFSDYINDPKIVEDGALYVGQNYFWESGAYYWSVYKPGTAQDDSFDLNKKCDENESVREITKTLNGDGDDKLTERTEAYDYYIGKFNDGN